MVIDSSAVIAIVFGEPEAPRLIDAIAADPVRLIGAPTLVEAAAVLLARIGMQGDLVLDSLLQRLDMTVAPMSPDAASVARSAYARFGKGVGSPAVLNYGDCLAYGMAMAVGEPLLFKGDGFPKTDVAAAPY